MKDESAKYLVVNADNITKQLYEVERVAYCNDFDNIYHRVNKISANKIFAKNNVPAEFQKIIVKISEPFFLNKEAEEYTTGFPFDFATKIIEKTNNKKYIRMNNSPISYDGSIFDDKIVFKTEVKYASFNDVMYLFEEMYKKGCLDNYLQSVKEFLDVSLDLQLLFETWHETKNKRKALKLYKYRVATKKI